MADVSRTRFFDTPTTLDESGIIVFQNINYPDTSQKSDDQIIVTELGDRLDVLAYKYYGDVRLLWVIALWNNLYAINQIEPVEALKVLRIPSFGRLSRILGGGE